MTDYEITVACDSIVAHLTQHGTATRADLVKLLSIKEYAVSRLITLLTKKRAIRKSGYCTNKAHVFSLYDPSVSVEPEKPKEVPIFNRTPTLGLWGL